VRNKFGSASAKLQFGFMNDLIVIDPKICHGKPVIRGTRLPVSIVVGSLQAG